jgi:hypothetical protein
LVSLSAQGIPGRTFGAGNGRSLGRGIVVGFEDLFSGGIFKVESAETSGETEAVNAALSVSLAAEFVIQELLRPPMDLQGACERGDRGQQALLQSDKRRVCERRLVGGSAEIRFMRRAPYSPCRARSNSGVSSGRPSRMIGLDLRAGKGWPSRRRSDLEPPHHDGPESLGRTSTPREPLGIEHPTGPRMNWNDRCVRWRTGTERCCSNRSARPRRPW